MNLFDIVCLLVASIAILAALRPSGRGGNVNPTPTYPRPPAPPMPPACPPREPLECLVVLRGGPCDGLTVAAGPLTKYYDVPDDKGGVVRYTLYRAEAMCYLPPHPTPERRDRPLPPPNRIIKEGESK